jgi:hypothetical protein
MLRKKLGLSTEPQPVFVGACFALLMLLMQFDFIYIGGKTHELYQYFNEPTTLTQVMLNAANNDITSTISWMIDVVAPLAMFIVAAVWGKKHARLLILPSALLAVSAVIDLVLGSYIFNYNVIAAIYIATVVFYALTPIIKTSMPFFVYCMVLSVLALILTICKIGSFVSADGDIYISLLIYFVSYHIAVGNFARAIPIQTKENKKIKKKK